MLPEAIRSRLSVPVAVAPLFLVSGIELVVASCTSGVIGSIPAANARTDDILDTWLGEIRTRLAAAERNGGRVAPYAVNVTVHKTNARLQTNLDVCVKNKVPIVITSLGPSKEVVRRVHEYGGVVWHDVTNLVHARKAAQTGVDGLILVCAGAGGHGGIVSPFALLPKVREFFNGTIVLAGGIGDGRAARAAQCMGADLVYMGTRFIATKESLASETYRNLLVEGEVGPSPSFLPIIYTDQISGIHANFIRASLERAGLDPDDLSEAASKLVGEEDFTGSKTVNEGQKAWRDIVSGGHGILNIKDIPSTAELVERIKKEYEQALLTPRL